MRSGSSGGVQGTFMPDDSFRDLTRAASGDLDALTRVMPKVYEHARNIARRIVAGDRAQRWVHASSLVSMAYLRLAKHDKIDFNDEARVVATLTRIMRRVVIDVVRREQALKRGGRMSRVSMHTDGLVPRQTQVDALEIEDAMVALAAVCNESAAVAELRLWGGLELEQIATALDMPFSRVRSRWNRAKAWLARELTESEARTSKGSVANDK
jgi:RNA polymerase sigma factor (TIGR02999 family)